MKSIFLINVTFGGANVSWEKEGREKKKSIDKFASEPRTLFTFYGNASFSFVKFYLVVTCR